MIIGAQCIKGDMIENRGQILHFLPRLKLGDGLAKCLNKFREYRNTLYTIGRLGDLNLSVNK